MERFLSWFASFFLPRGRGGIIQNYGVGQASVGKHLIVGNALQEAQRFRH
jgi:hypothetical protein